jgi:hypothetical protein
MGAQDYFFISLQLTWKKKRFATSIQIIELKILILSINFAAVIPGTVHLAMIFFTGRFPTRGLHYFLHSVVYLQRLQIQHTRSRRHMTMPLGEALSLE